MKAVKYIRVSSASQNIARQTDTSLFTLVDTCSGFIPFAKREKGSKLLRMIKSGEVSELHIHSIDRLGRNVRDIRETVDLCTEHGVCVVSEKEGIRTLRNGKEDITSKLMLNILGTLAEFERERIRERQAEGIAKAKERKRYAGRTEGTTEPLEVFLNKAKSQKALKELKSGESIRRTAEYANVSIATVQKVKRIAIEKGILV